MFNTANTKLQNSLNTTRSASTSTTKPIAEADEEIDREGQDVNETFENDRMGGELRNGDPRKYSDRDAAAGSGSDAFPEFDLPEGFEWSSEWEVDTSYTLVDKDGRGNAKGLSRLANARQDGRMARAFAT